LLFPFWQSSTRVKAVLPYECVQKKSKNVASILFDSIGLVFDFIQTLAFLNIWSVPSRKFNGKR
jgi:hypothetical protein